MTSTTSDPLQSDLTAVDVAWDLEPLVDGRGAEGVDALLDDAEARAQALASYRGRVGELDAEGLAELMRELATIGELAGRAGSYAGLKFAVDTADPVAGALMARTEERGTAISNEILFVELEWAAVPDEQADGAPRRRSARVLPALPRFRPSLPPAPAQRARGAGPRRQVAHRQQRVGAPVLGAHLGDHRRPRGCLREPRAGTLAAHVARTRGAALRRRRGHRGTGARAAHARVRVQHVARRQVDRRPVAELPRLVGEPEPRQRGERRVGAGAHRRGAVPLRHPAAVVHAEGAAAGAAQAGRLRPHGVGRELRRGVRLERGPTAGARRVLVVLAGAGVGGASGSSTSRGSTRRSVRASVPARSARTPCRASTRTCCSTGPRADATCSPSPTRWVTGCTHTSRASRGSTTRPRRSPSPRPRRCSARPSPSGASSTPPTTRPRAWRSSPRASKGRSRPSSARSR